MSSAVGVLARWAVPLLTVVGVTLSAAPVQTGPPPAVRLVDAANPLAGHSFFVDPTSPAMAAAHNANPPSAELDAIANTPQAHWVDPGVSSAAVAGYVGAAQAAGSMPVLALYAIPHRDCGSFAAGGFATGADYRQWIDGLAAAVGSSPAAVIVEPDALDMADCLSPAQRDER